MLVLFLFVAFITSPLWLLALAYGYAIYCRIHR